MFYEHITKTSDLCRIRIRKIHRNVARCLFISILSQVCEVRITLTYYFRNTLFVSCSRLLPDGGIPRFTKVIVPLKSAY